MNNNINLIEEKAKKYDEIKKKQKISIDKYHKTDNGKNARKKASTKYYELHRLEILARKKLRYEKNKLKFEGILSKISKE
jgi:DNA-dependent RNA polymerase auxiliary subunit epsilon